VDKENVVSMYSYRYRIHINIYEGLFVCKISFYSHLNKDLLKVTLATAKMKII